MRDHRFMKSILWPVKMTLKITWGMFKLVLLITFLMTQS